jgi:hypothetical protein
MENTKRIAELVVTVPDYPEINCDLGSWGYDDCMIIGDAVDARTMLGLHPDCLEMDKSQIVTDTGGLE